MTPSLVSMPSPQISGPRMKLGLNLAARVPLRSLGPHVPDEHAVVPAAGEQNVGLVLVVLAAVNARVVAGRGAVRPRQTHDLFLGLVVEDPDLKLACGKAKLRWVPSRTRRTASPRR